MPLNKDYIVPATGATASYHVVQQVSLDYVSTKTNATVASYLTKDARDAGKFTLCMQQVMFDGLPADGQAVLDFAEAQLVVDAPTDGTGASYPGRYIFAGAAIVA